MLDPLFNLSSKSVFKVAELCGCYTQSQYVLLMVEVETLQQRRKQLVCPTPYYKCLPIFTQ